MIEVDTHTHSIASGHAYSTLQELAQAAHEKSLKGFVLTDHAPAMPGGAHIYHFYNQRVLPRTIHGVVVFKGAEANILNSSGEIDLEEESWKELEFVVASLHPPCFPPSTKEEHTQGYINAMQLPVVKAIGHPDDGRFPFDVEAVVDAASKTGTLLELNNTSISPKGFRVGAQENCRRLLQECKKRGCYITVASDAHYSSLIGESSYVEELIRELDFPEELIANKTMERFLELTNLTI